MLKVSRFEVFGLSGIPEITSKTNLGRLITKKAESQNTPLMQNDVIVVAQKIVSKSENRLIPLSSVESFDKGSSIDTDTFL